MATLWGLTGVKDWSSTQVPDNYRKGILFLYPNGSVPLTGLTSQMPSEKVDNYEFNWHTESLPTQGGAFTKTEIYTDSTLADGVKLGAGGSVAGTVLFVKVAEAIAAEFRPGHEVQLRDESHYDMTCVAKVLNVVKNGASSFINIKLLEIDDNGVGGPTDLRDADYIYVLGDMSPDAGTMPEAVNYQPVKISNFTQTIRTSMMLSRRAKQTRLRTGDAYQVEKRRKTLIHGIELEKIWLKGIKSENYGLNGEIETTTMGLIPCITQYAAANCNDYRLNTDFSGDSWAAGGCEWLFKYLEQIARYGEKIKVAYAGSGALLGILHTAKLEAQLNMTSETKAFGIQVTRIVLPFITLEIYTHPLFSYTPADRNSMVIFEPAKLRFRFMQDTTFKPDDGERKGGKGAIDGTFEEFLTDAGLEFHHPSCFGYLNGIGLANTLS